MCRGLPSCRGPAPVRWQRSPDAGVAHSVERNLAKVEVAGSKPVSRSNPHLRVQLEFVRGPSPSWVPVISAWGVSRVTLSRTIFLDNAGSLLRMLDLTVVPKTEPTAIEQLVGVAACRARGVSPKTIRFSYGYSLNGSFPALVRPARNH
jgi:hypothetical protein